MHRCGCPIGSIYEISVYERVAENERRWDWDALVAALQKLVDESGHTLVRTAGERGLRRLGHCNPLLSVTLPAGTTKKRFD